MALCAGVSLQAHNRILWRHHDQLLRPVPQQNEAIGVRARGDLDQKDNLSGLWSPVVQGFKLPRVLLHSASSEAVFKSKFHVFLDILILQIYFLTLNQNVFPGYLTDSSASKLHWTPAANITKKSYKILGYVCTFLTRLPIQHGYWHLQMLFENLSYRKQPPGQAHLLIRMLDDTYCMTSKYSNVYSNFANFTDMQLRQMMSYASSKGCISSTLPLRT